VLGNLGLCGLLEEGAHGKSPKCLGGNLGDFGEFCKGLNTQIGRLKNQHPVFQMAYFITDAAGREIRPALCR